MKVQLKRRCGHAETVKVRSEWRAGAARVIPGALRIEEGRACHNCRFLPGGSPQWRHVGYVGALALEVSAAKASLHAVRMSMWGHSSDLALWSRMDGREGDALLAAKAHDALLPLYSAAVPMVSDAVRNLSDGLSDYAERWGSLMTVNDHWLTPEVNHHCDGNHNHSGQTWRMPHCVLCRNRVSSQ